MARQVTDTPEARRARRATQQADYDRRNTRGIYLKLNKGTDDDVLSWLDRQESKQGAIKRLIREDIARAGAGE